MGVAQPGISKNQRSILLGLCVGLGSAVVFRLTWKALIGHLLILQLDCMRDFLSVELSFQDCESTVYCSPAQRNEEAVHLESLCRLGRCDHVSFSFLVQLWLFDGVDRTHTQPNPAGSSTVTGPDFQNDGPGILPSSLVW